MVGAETSKGSLMVLTGRTKHRIELDGRINYISPGLMKRWGGCTSINLKKTWTSLVKVIIKVIYITFWDTVSWSVCIGFLTTSLCWWFYPQGCQRKWKAFSVLSDISFTSSKKISDNRAFHDTLIFTWHYTSYIGHFFIIFYDWDYNVF